jgi:spore coat protein U-like protein
MRAALLAPLLALLPAQAWAADCTTQVSPLVFGQFRAIDGTTADITATITVSCVAIAPEAVAYELRIAAAAGGATRAMHGATGDLAYELYTSLNGRQRWGDGTGGTGVVAGSMSLVAGERHSQSYTVYGRILADRRARAGAYTDVLPVYLVLRP